MASRRLVVEDPGGQFLDELIVGPLAVPDFLRLAIGIAKALGCLHARGLVHKDVKPANIIVKAEPGEVWLTGFGLTSRLPRHRQPPVPPEIIAGTLAYMAPEQTGRMNRSDGFPERPLLTWGHALRNADRQSSVHSCRSDGMGALPHSETAAIAERAVGERPRHGLRDHHEAARQDGRGTLPVGGRSGERSSALPF